MTMSRRALIQQSAAVAALTFAGRAARARSATSGWYDKAIIIDGLSSLGDPYSPEAQTRLSDRVKQELRQTGLTAINATVGAVGNSPSAYEEMTEGIKTHDSVVLANPDFLLVVRSAADIRAAKASGRLGLIYGTQDTAMIGTALDRVAELKTRGVRIMQLTYNLRNLSGDGALEPGNAGLSRLGRATIERIEGEKLLLDLSHGGQRTIAEAIAAAKRPLSINHTGCRDLFDHPRNVFDAELKALADKGGVAGIYFMPFLARGSKPTGEDLIRHVEHAAKVCGEDHVSIGTDGNPLPIPINEETWKRAREAHEFRSKNGFAAPGEGPDVLTIVHDYNSLDRFQRLSAALAKRGWTTAQLEKLFGGNLMRLYAEAWGG